MTNLSAFCFDREEDWDFDPRHTQPYFSALHVDYDFLDEETDNVAEDPDDGFHYKSERWASEKGHAVPVNKGLTLRSWRNPKMLGGSHSRKATAVKMARRLPVRHAIWGGAPELSFVG